MTGLRELLSLLFGVALIGASAMDVVWTTLGTHGGGPLSGPAAGVRLEARRPDAREAPAPSTALVRRLDPAGHAADVVRSCTTSTASGNAPRARCASPR